MRRPRVLYLVAPALVAAALLGWRSTRIAAVVLLGALGSAAVVTIWRWRAERDRLRARSEEAERRFTFLADASTVLSASLDSDVTLASVARLAVPVLADWCTVDLLEPDGSARRVALAYGNPAKAELVRGAEIYPPDPHGTHPRTRVLRTGRAELFPDIDDADLASVTANPDQLRVMRSVGYRSAMIVPLVARAQTVGALTLATAHSGRRYGPVDLALSEDLARRAALAIENARLYGEAQRARTQAEAASRAKDEFLSLVSHELRTPLASALLWARMLARREVAHERVAHAAESIERSMRRQARLIEDLLDVSRIVTGSLRIDLRPVDLPAVIDAAVRTVVASAAAKRIEIAWTPDAAGGRVFGDPGRLEQMVCNLLENAVEYTPEGGRIAVSLLSNGSRTQVRVSDTGEGIAPDLLPHVFDRFRQGDSTSTRSHGGLGLGLTIVHDLVALHGGTVHAESEGRGRGASFTIDLPTATPAATAKAG